MRKLYFILLLFTSFTGFGFSPPTLNQPTDLKACDTNNDGNEVFDLTTKISEILGALNPSLYTVSFHETATDSELGANAVPATAYVNITPFSQTLWVRVRDNATNEYSLTILTIKAVPSVLGEIITPSALTLCGDSEAVITFRATGGEPPYLFLYRINGELLYGVQSNSGNTADLVVPGGNGPVHVELEQMHTILNELPGCNQIANTSVDISYVPFPAAGEPQDIIIEQDPYIGNAVFDLTVNGPVLTSAPDVVISYHLTLADAQVGTNAIANPTNFFATSGTIIYAAVPSSGSICTTVKSFGLYCTNSDIVFIPDANFKAKLLAASPSNNTAFNAVGANFKIDANNNGEIEVSEALTVYGLNVEFSNIASAIGINSFTNIKALDIQLNQLTTLDVTGLGNLMILKCLGNQLSTLNVAGLSNLENLSCEDNQIVTLDVSGLSALTYLNCQGNNISSLITTGLTNIQTIECDGNQLTSLDMNSLTTLTGLVCGNNFITSLDCSQLTSLETLLCNYNQMTYLDVSQCPLLTNLDCSENALVNLDLSNNSLLCTLNCSANEFLETVNIKNGVDSCYSSFNLYGNHPALQQFCCDDNEVAYFKNYFLTNMGENINVNSYCSFTPGGDYNTISANATFDANNNGCDAGDSIYPYLRVNINDGTNSGAAFTGISGGAVFFTQAGNFTITPSVENTSWFNISPSSVVIPFTNTNNNTANQNFCITANGVHPDLEIVMAPLISARPGFDADYIIVVKNKGNQIMSQPNGITFVYPSSFMTLLSINTSFSTSAPGILHWNLDTIQPFETKNYMIRMNINPPTHPTAPVNIGTIFTFVAGVDPMTGDETIPDNTFNLSQTVVGSYDPNEILCLEGNVVSPVEIGNYLHYIINFENTGNADAENIVVREVIDTTQFDITSLQLLNSSAAVTTRLTGNLAEFIFPSINLHSGGHGNILLKIRSNNTLTEGDMVSKTANIYFDYNFPVETQPEDTVFQSLSNPDINIDASVTIYPNPTKGLITIECNNTIKSIQLYDAQGRILQTNLINENRSSVDISSEAKGVYFIKIISDHGMKVQKIVRE